MLGCYDDPGARRLLKEATRVGQRSLSYGLNHWAGMELPDYSAGGLTPNALGGFSFEVIRRERRSPAMRVDLKVPGRHNVSNALACLAVIDYLHLPLEQAAQALGQFTGTGRRFEVRGEARGVMVIDDYAHHPSEILATLAAARTSFPERRIWAVWQPHTYSRTRTLLPGFSTAFEHADHVLVTDIYAARESSPANGFSSQQVVENMQHPEAKYVSGFSQVADYLLDHIRSESVVLVLSAGDADQISELLLRKLA